ncbi:hypothetical protein LCGC14_0369790 [marine sediment metagenome]|uniref:Uncharacterized protein n=1 Tax=marine sediment metagenome TaxID=412755 RepID=A0A0F9T5G7_9ZZZZ
MRWKKLYSTSIKVCLSTDIRDIMKSRLPATPEFLDQLENIVQLIIEVVPEHMEYSHEDYISMVVGGKDDATRVP